MAYAHLAALVEDRDELDRWLYAPADGWEAAESRLLTAIATTEGGDD